MNDYLRKSIKCVSKDAKDNYDFYVRCCAKLLTNGAVEAIERAETEAKEVMENTVEEDIKKSK